MLVLRSLVFNIAFYLNMVMWMVGALPSLVLPRRALVMLARGWAFTSLFLLRALAGIRYEVRGREHIPAGGLLVAAKHQSVWETFALFLVFDDPCYILKRELQWIPVFGWYLKKDRMVPVDRGARSRAMKAMNIAAKAELDAGRQILIFPEGTRRPPGAEPAYKYGVAFLYSEMGVPCVPVALNSGVFWPRRRFIRRPGTIVVDVLEPIPPGLDRAAFFERLQRDVETATNRLLGTAPGTAAAEAMATTRSQRSA